MQKYACENGIQTTFREFRNNFTIRLHEHEPNENEWKWWNNDDFANVFLFLFASAVYHRNDAHNNIRLIHSIQPYDTVLHSENVCHESWIEYDTIVWVDSVDEWDGLLCIDW